MGLLTVNHPPYKTLIYKRIESHGEDPFTTVRTVQTIKQFLA